jgi:phosphate-selective porin OprO/OprP
MRQAIFGALVSLLTVAGAGFAQQPASPESLPTLNGGAMLVPPQAGSAGADEIQALKAATRQIQERLNQLAPPAGGQSAGPAPASSMLSAKFPVLPVDGSSSGGPGSPAESTSDTGWPLNGTWKYGLQIESADQAFRVHVGGNLQFDSGWNAASDAVQFGPGGTGELQDGAYFRRARIRIDGTMYEHFEWVAQFDFANNVENDTSSSTQTIGSPSFSDVWFGANDLPLVGTLRAGWMKEPIGFDHLTSSRWLNFMERAPGADSLGLHSPGIMMIDHTENERVTWAFGFFHAQNDNFGFGVGDGQYAETGRVTWLPWYQDGGCELVHLGLGATHRHLSGDQIDIHGRPSVRTMPGSLEPSLADTGTIDGTTQEVLDLELAAVFGRWTLQSEYYCTFIHDAVFPAEPPPEGIALGTLFYQGTYVELLYFLTGEHRDYDRRAAVFDRVIPLRNFNIWKDQYGWGAWQVGIRYAYLDLQDKGVNGATLNDIVLGLNWFLNPNAKIQWNFAIDHRDSTPPGSSGWTYIFGTRLALDF